MVEAEARRPRRGVATGGLKPASTDVGFHGGMAAAHQQQIATAAPAPGTPERPWDLARTPRIPVARPRLAPLEAALPYLRAIDDARSYSNFGPVNGRLEDRFGAHFGLPPGHVVTCNNATTGLTLALQAAAARGGRYCIMPAWTFAATAHAAIAAGLTPFLTDVDPQTGALTPQIAKAALRLCGEPAAVVPVAPFGYPLDPEAWDLFQELSGVPVVIDAAAGFDALKPGMAPAVVSLHATKALGIGEGGFVVSRDPHVIADIRRRSNFGFDGTRDSTLSGCNGKLSEYGAAFGHAALDLWPLQRSRHLAVLAYYRAALADMPALSMARGLGESWACTTCNIEADAEAILEIEVRLAASGIATRRWWGRGLQGHQGFRTLPRTELPVTYALAARTLGLPCFPEIEPPALDEIIATVRAVLSA